jgi:hypothetical protein
MMLRVIIVVMWYSEEQETHRVVGDGYGGGDYKGAFVGTQYKINKGLAGKKKMT